MVNMTQAAFDEAIAKAAEAAATAAIANMPQDTKKDDSNRGACWYPKEDGKTYALAGNVHPKCPHCDTVTKFGIYLYTAGGDGVNKLPVYRFSLLEWKDKPSK